MRKIFSDIGERINDVLAVTLGSDFEIAAAQRIEPRPGRQHPLSYVQSDLAPLVDGPDSVVFIRLIDVAVQKLKAEPFSTCFLSRRLASARQLLMSGQL